jgi:hypothetical protein
MSVFEALAPAKPSPERGALRIKRTLAQTFDHIEASLALVREIVERHGRDPVKTALGADSKQADALYAALQAVVKQNKPGADVPDLPS